MTEFVSYHSLQEFVMSVSGIIGAYWSQWEKIDLVRLNIALSITRFYVRDISNSYPQSILESK